MPEKRCRELDELLESMDEYDRKFLLWKLLCEKRNELYGDVFKESPKTKEEYIVMRMKNRHYSAVTEMTELLCYDLF